jgi:hypothetical protein
MSTRETVESITTRCECEHPYPQPVDGGLIWVCGFCGELTVDPRIDLQAQAVIDRFRSLLDGEPAQNGTADLMTAAEVAKALGRSLTYVRKHRDELAVEYHGGGKLPRMFFPRDRVIAHLDRGER